MKIVHKRPTERQINKDALREGFEVQLVNETPGRTWQVLLDDACAVLESVKGGAKQNIAWLHPTKSAKSVDAALAGKPELAQLQSLRGEEAALKQKMGKEKLTVSRAKVACKLPDAQAALAATEAACAQLRAQIEAIEGAALGLTPSQCATRSSYLRLIEQRTALLSAQTALYGKRRASSSTEAMRKALNDENEANAKKIMSLTAAIKDVERGEQQVKLDVVAPGYVASDYFGFQVDGNGRFVVSERCFVTHNSTLLKLMCGDLNGIALNIPCSNIKKLFFIFKIVLLSYVFVTAQRKKAPYNVIRT